jgi:hypothetical protein
MELCDSIKRLKLQIMGIEEKEVQAKGICNIFNIMIAENFPNLEREMPRHVQEASKTPNKHDQNITSPRHIIIITTTTEYKERIFIQNKSHMKSNPSK